MKNKKILLIISYLFIFVFHLWIPITSSEIEKYVTFLCYIGVDIFFFLSASSMAKKDIEYKSFIQNRFLNIYLKFVIFTLLAFFIKHYSILRVFQILIGYELLKKGGGAFLWFIPAIMILYLFFPFYKKWTSKYKLVIVSFIWICFTILLSLTNYKAIFIFTNRLPIFFLGYYLNKKDAFKDKNKNLFLGIVLFVLGSFISYLSYKTHIHISFLRDAFYLFNIPLILGIIFLMESMNQVKVDKLSKISLELYALQMIFGFSLAGKLYLKLQSALLTNICCFVILFTLSYLCSYLFKLVIKK